MVSPEFPPSARTVNVYGQVSVHILINENGDVIFAKAVSGHPLLSFSSEKAALKSKFEPLTLGGSNVRISGNIVYNFIPEKWNWLEIGFTLGNSWSSYYSLKTLSETLPVGYEEESQIVKQSSENQDEVIKTVIALIRGKLNNDEKASWLFSVGLAFAKVKQNCCRTDENMQNLIHRIEFLLHSKPSNVSTALVSNLEKIVFLARNPNLNTYSATEGDKIYQLLRNSEETFPYLGR